MAIKKKAAAKKVVARKTAKKKVVAKKIVAKNKVSVRKAVQKELTGVEIAQKIALQNPKLWSTDFPSIPVDHFLPKKTASKWIRNFNRRKLAIPKNAFMQPSNINKQIVVDMLSRPEVKYLRFYFGLNEHNRVQVIFVGADANHNDVYVQRVSVADTLPANTAAKSAVNTAQSDDTTTEDGAIDMSQGCPSYGSGETVMLPQ